MHARGVKMINTKIRKKNNDIIELCAILRLCLSILTTLLQVNVYQTSLYHGFMSEMFLDNHYAIN